MQPRAAGKFIDIGGDRFLVKGVSYGTFAPDREGHQFPSLSRVRDDFAAMARAGFNTVRTYTVPTVAMLDEAARQGLRVMIGMPWSQHVAFLDDAKMARGIRRDAAATVKALGTHPAALMFAVGNEIPPAVVRWHGQARIVRFLEDLYRDVKAASPDSLITYVNYPPTEYLALDFFDVCSFNVYLHREADLRAYLARLQQIANARPLLLAEAGADSIREGLDGQAAITAMHARAAFEEGLCGAVAFSWTDEWWRGGNQIHDWAFGLVDADRQPKPALAAVSETFAAAPFTAAQQQAWPKVSVVVCAYNAADTLVDCLESLGRLTYPSYEVIVVNDGSRDATGEIAHRYPVRVIDIPNGGLSAARNVGLSAATGEIVAYTDADVRVDQDWLTYLVQPMLASDVIGSGGPNVVPADDPLVAQCVARAPGGPTHVLLDDRVAEHVPGCNMAFRRDALLGIGGFNPVYLRAGDDVDICWRLQAKKLTIGFAPAALVWHHHRPSIKAYWRQQVGYGEGEAWLDAHHPEKFVHGTMLWRGRIYSPLPFIRSLTRQRVNSGTWGSAAFPSVYSVHAHPAQLLPHSPAWQMAATCALVLGLVALATPYVGLAVSLLVAGAAGWATTIGRCLMFGWHSQLDGVSTVQGPASRLQHRLLIAWLHFLQPLARFTGRLRGAWSPPPVIVPERATRLTWKAPIPERGDAAASARLLVGGAAEQQFWSESWTSHDALLTETAGLLRAARPARLVDVDDGWRPDRDVSIGVGRWGWLDVRTLIEEHGGARCLLHVGMRLRPALVGVTLALGLAALSIVATSASMVLRWPSLSIACVLVVVAIFSRAAWQTTAAVTLARKAVERAALTAGMSPIPLRQQRHWWQFNPRAPMATQRVQAVVLALLAAGAAQTGSALFRGQPGEDGRPVGTTGIGIAEPAAVLTFDSGGDVKVTPDGDLLFADARRGMIQRLDLSTLGEPMLARAVESDSRELISAEGRIDAPSSVAVAASGDVYVADARHHRISRIDGETGELVTLVGTGTAGFDGDLKAAAATRIHSPSSVAIAANGDVYFADTGNHRIRMVSAATGRVRTIAGTGESGSASDDAAAIGDGGPAIKARLNAPADLAIGPDGDIYIADMGHNRVRVVDGISGVITTVAGNGRAVSRGDGGPAIRAGLAGPAGLALSVSRSRVTVFVAEYVSGRVRTLMPGGLISTVGSQRFTAPSRLAYRRGGRLYVVDGEGTVTVLNVSGSRPVQVAALITRGRRDNVLAAAAQVVE